MGKYIETTTDLGFSPAIAEICMVRSPRDGKWHRAALIESDKDEFGFNYFFLLVDRADSIGVKVNDIRPIPKRFVECLPYMAVQAYLKETRGKEDVDAETVKLVTELLPPMTVTTATVIDREGDIYVVEIPAVTAALTRNDVV